MSGHTRWAEVREQELRSMTPDQRAYRRARHRALVEDLRFQVWRLNLEERFLDAMAAAAAGDPVAWETWPAPPTAAELSAAAEAEFGLDLSWADAPDNDDQFGGLTAALAALRAYGWHDTTVRMG